MFCHQYLISKDIIIHDNGHSYMLKRGNIIQYFIQTNTYGLEPKSGYIPGLERSFIESYPKIFKPLRPLKPYRAMVKDGECAILVFAHNIKEVKNIANRFLSEWEEDFKYTDIRITRIYNDWIYREIDIEILMQDLPYLVDDPKTCPNCDRWGAEVITNTGCTDCGYQ